MGAGPYQPSERCLCHGHFTGQGKQLPWPICKPAVQRPTCPECAAQGPMFKPYSQHMFHNAAYLSQMLQM